MVVKSNPEFGIELALVVPYAYYLHTKGKLNTVITSRGMKPFYYFCDDVREEFKFRTIDNAAAGLNELPNNWIHHNATAIFGKGHGELSEEDQSKANGQLDYSKWEVPPYREYYKNEEYKFKRKMVFITNKYNLEHGHKPYGFFDIKCLYDMFVYLTSSGYDVIYKRPKNTEFVIDQNEMFSLQNHDLDINADVDGIGSITDRDLPKYFDNVYLFDDLIDKHSYNETQMKIMANSDYFITQSGGNAILSCLWNRPTITYITQGAELRPNYFSENSYFQKISNQKCIPVFDIIGEINKNHYNHKINNTGKNNYSGLMNTVKEIISGDK
tara:strand:+ start:65 stop:1045 length:981 start_codon:yes stop_codon:yes gene_type:complete